MNSRVRLSSIEFGIMVPAGGTWMNFNIEIEVETDGRFIAEVVELPSVLVYGQTEEEASKL